MKLPCTSIALSLGGWLVVFMDVRLVCSLHLLSLYDLQPTFSNGIHTRMEPLADLPTESALLKQMALRQTAIAKEAIEQAEQSLTTNPSGSIQTLGHLLTVKDVSKELIRIFDRIKQVEEGRVPALAQGLSSCS
ncbi:hypothetical protein V8E36_009211 [Tilletia maclaganii]